MGNGGWHGTTEAWDRLEAPFNLLDPELGRFARKHGLALTRNHKDWPERSLGWGNDVRCLLQVFLLNESALTLKLWICASQDRDGARYCKNETLHEGIASELAPELPKLLELGKRKLDD